MNIENASSQNSLLREMVKVKKLRFQDQETWKDSVQVTRDLLQRSENFREFKAVYEEALHCKLSGDGQKEVHETKSGSVCRVPRIKPHCVDTVNIELPPHYGGDRAVQLIENKIKPKKACRVSKVSKEVTTEPPVEHKTKKVVSFADTVKLVENTEQTLFTQTPNPIKEANRVEKPIKPSRKVIKYKISCKPAVTAKPLLKKPNDTKIMDALIDINEKLQKMQEKYFKIPKVQYKNVNDCFTQSGHVEILYANEKYPEKSINQLKSPNVKHVSQVILSDSKMKERIKEMNEMFPEFPKIEDTLKEIENHLDNIVKLNDNSVEEELTADILKHLEQNKDQKLKSIRHQIDEVEDFCDKLSEIAKEDELKSVSSESSVNIQNHLNSSRNVSLPKKRSPRTYVNNADDDSNDVNAPRIIEKSSYLSKEFSNLNGSPPSMVKIFSENKLAFWKDRMREIKRQNEGRSVESVTKILDTFKFSFENSIYEPVTK